jgi:hypothetical protein
MNSDSNTNKDQKGHHEALLRTLEELLKKSEKNPVQLKEILKEVKGDGFAFLSLIHALPLVQPIPLGPLAMAAGGSLAYIGVQILQNKKTPWLPKKMANTTPSKKICKILLITYKKTLNICRKFARPRMQTLATGTIGRRFSGIIILISGILIALPFAAIPFTTTFPALAAIFASMAEPEEDGLFNILAVLMSLLAITYMGLILWGGASLILPFLPA